MVISGVTGVVSHKPGLTGTQQIKTDIDEMARSANNFMNTFERCLGNFKEEPILIPQCILSREKTVGVFADSGCRPWLREQLVGSAKTIDSTQIGGDSGAGL